MSKKSRKLAVKKETLRTLDGQQLEQIRGGNLEWVVLRQPSRPTTNPTGTDPPTYFAYNFNPYLYYW